MAADYVYQRALDLLDAAADGLAAARTGHAVPSRQYVAHGRPAVDICDDPTSTGQLTVHVDVSTGIHHRATPDHPNVPRTLLIQPIATFVVQVWRCWPTMEEDGAAPSTATLQAAAESLNRDAWALLTQIYAEHFASTLFQGVSCEAVTIGTLRPVGDPSGGTAGWEMTVDLALNDPTTF